VGREGGGRDGGCESDGDRLWGGGGSLEEPRRQWPPREGHRGGVDDGRREKRKGGWLWRGRGLERGNGMTRVIVVGG